MTVLNRQRRDITLAFEAPAACLRLLAAAWFQGHARPHCRDCPAHIHGGEDDDDAPEIPTAAEKNIYRSRLDLRGSDWTSNIPRRLDLLCDHLRLFVGLWLGLDSCPHPRIAGRRGDDLSVAVGSGSASICDLQSFCHSSGIADLHCLVRWRHRDRDGLVVACSEQQTLKLDRRGRCRPP